VINKGRRRLLDVTITATLAVTGLVEDARTNQIVVRIPTKDPWLPYLSSSRLIPLRVRDLDPQELGSFPRPSAVRTRRAGSIFDSFWPWMAKTASGLIFD